MRSFHTHLPASFRNIVNKKEEESDPPNNKRKRQDGDDQNLRRIENEGKIKSWLLGDDTYNSKLKGNFEILKSRPEFKGTALCHRFHSRGYCFGNCPNKESHVISSSLPNEVKQSYKKWIKANARDK